MVARKITLSKIKHIDLLLISVDSPILLGIYENKKLVKSLSKDGKFSDSLPNLFGKVLAEYFAKEQNTNSSIADEFLGLCEVCNDDKTNRLSRKRTEALPKKSPQDALNIYCANGPGNFSAIKLTHIFLQTLQISLNALLMRESSTAQSNKVRLFCADAFHFSDSKFINAYGKIHFVKENGEIRTTTLESKRVNSFTLPKTLDTSIFSDKCAPLYILPAV